MSNSSEDLYISEYYVSEDGNIIAGTEMRDDYIDLLNSTESIVTILGIEFDPANVLMQLDWTAFECGWNDFTDGHEEFDTLEEAEAYAETI